MLGLRHEDAADDPLNSAAAADALWLKVGQSEPLAAVRAVCDALAQSIEQRAPHIDRLRSLFVVDRRAQMLLERMLLELASISVEMPAQERQLRHAVFELCRALAQGYHRFLQHVRSSWLRNEWTDAAPAILVRLFYHRQVELLLHLFRYEPWPHGRWRESHDIYRWWRRIAPSAPVRNAGEIAAAVPTPDDMYTRMLLTQRLDCGQFTAPELAFARKRITRWSSLVSLSPLTPGAAMPRNAYVVDLAGADGLRRACGARDHSESGSRLRGRVSNPRRTMSGALLAFREDGNAPWTLAIVRRLARLPGSNVEVGVEHLGRNPQPLLLTPREAAPVQGETQVRFPALYLRDCATRVPAPMKALVVPAACFEPGRIFTAVSTRGETSVRLGEAIERRSDFVWTAFDVVGTPAVS